MQVIDGLPKRGHCPSAEIDHHDERRIRAEGSEVKPIVEIVHRVEIAKRRDRGRSQGDGNKWFSSEGIDEVGLLCLCSNAAGRVDVPQIVDLVEREPIRDVSIPVLGNSVAMPVCLSILTNVSLLGVVPGRGSH